jgi:hypothetical protein
MRIFGDASPQGAKKVSFGKPNGQPEGVQKHRLKAKGSC